MECKFKIVLYNPLKSKLNLGIIVIVIYFIGFIFTSLLFYLKSALPIKIVL